MEIVTWLNLCHRATHLAVLDRDRITPTTVLFQTSRYLKLAKTNPTSCWAPKPKEQEQTISLLPCKRQQRLHRQTIVKRSSSNSWQVSFRPNPAPPIPSWIKLSRLLPQLKRWTWLMLVQRRSSICRRRVTCTLTHRWQTSNRLTIAIRLEELEASESKRTVEHKKTTKRSKFREYSWFMCFCISIRGSRKSSTRGTTRNHSQAAYTQSSG